MKSTALPAILSTAVLSAGAIAANVAIGTAAADPNNNATFSGTVLSSVVVNGINYSALNLIKVSIDSFAGGNSSSLLVNSATSGPLTAQQRRDLIETDLDGGTGIINPSSAPGTVTITFATPVINIAGADLLFFEINPGTGTSGDAFDITINSIDALIPGTAYGDTGATTNSKIFTIRNPGNTADITPSTLAEVLNNPTGNGSTGILQNIFGVGIDFSDFGVAPGASVSSFTFDSNGTNFVDPTIIVGVVPEPTTLGLLGIAGLGLLARRRRTV